MTKGTKYDGDKLRWDLLPLEEVEKVVEVLTFGANKYSPDNWRKVENPVERYYAATLRHISDWRIRGELFDKESGLPHLAHAICCLLFIMWFNKTNKEGNK